MVQLTLDLQQTQIVQGQLGRIEVKDVSGKHVGYLITDDPNVSLQELKDAFERMKSPPASDPEASIDKLLLLLQRKRSLTGDGLTTEQLHQYLHQLDSQ